MNRKIKNKKIERLVSGFTLIEMMVTLAIVTLLGSVVIFNYSAFNDNRALTGAAQEVAIAIRQAQVYALSVSQSSVGSNQFKNAFGIHFDKDDPTRYTLFVDNNMPSGSHVEVYDAGAGCGNTPTECVEQDSFRNGIQVSEVCNGADLCPPSSSVHYLDITFLRPNLDAKIRFTHENSQGFGGLQPTGKVKLASPRGQITTITVEHTGQISVQ